MAQGAWHAQIMTGADGGMLRRYCLRTIVPSFDGWLDLACGKNVLFGFLGRNQPETRGAIARVI